MKNKRVIIVTDGDKIAQKAVETAAKNIGIHCISRSAGNPTPLKGKEIINLIKGSDNDPIVLMVDDRGDANKGEGEQVIEDIYNDEELDIIGVIAVASNTDNAEGTEVDFSIENTGNITKQVVDKHGNPVNKRFLKGDTVDVLQNKDIYPIVGIGDPGKMMGNDDWIIGAPILTKAMEEILSRNKNPKR